jgi:hypothetical protein
MKEKPGAILPGTVEKIIKSPIPNEPEKAQIAVEGADHLYREIRITNTLTSENGDEDKPQTGCAGGGYRRSRGRSHDPQEIIQRFSGIS